MRIFKIFIEVEKEEQFLNEMAKNGLLFKKYNAFGVYTFVKGEPSDLRYKIDYRMFKRKIDFEQYKTLFEDAGFEHIYGTTYSGGQYYLPSSDNLDSADIFSDAESKAAIYKRFVNQSIIGLICMFVYAVMLFCASLFKYINWGYLTPGLWEKTGDAFWRAFLFETPFVLMRVFPFVVFIFLTSMYGYWAYKAHKLFIKYRKTN